MDAGVARAGGTPQGCYHDNVNYAVEGVYCTTSLFFFILFFSLFLILFLSFIFFSISSRPASDDVLCIYNVYIYICAVSLA